jgi:integrase
MNAPMLRFCGNPASPLETTKLSNYQPPKFPPPKDFFVSVNSDGNPLSKYSDDYWDFRAYGYYGFNFGARGLSPENKGLLKQAIFLYLYHMKLFPGKVRSLSTTFQALSSLCQFTDSQGITIDQLYRFPALAKPLMQALTTNQQQKLTTTLGALLREENVLGWKIADADFISRLSILQIPHINTQSAYIPPRIWMTLVGSIERAMDSFEQHQSAFVDAWTWVSEAYRHNIQNGYSEKSPFERPRSKSVDMSERNARRVYSKGAAAFLEEHGLAELLNRWVGYVPSDRYELLALTAYANFVRNSAFVYILAHSIQRVGEGLDLRFDCFVTDDDPILGKVAMLVGETTKTDPDSDARWVVPLQVERAIEILKTLGRLRLSNSLEPTVEHGNENPYLMVGTLEAWQRLNAYRVNQWTLDRFVTSHALAFDANELMITEEDYKIAYQLTPRLTEKDWFKVGGVWSFSAHQLRRTLAVNLFASDVDASIIQWMMKHRTANQSYYYGRNHTRLRVNRNATETVLVESYRTTTRILTEAAENSLGDCVHPAGKNLITGDTLKLIKEKEHKKLESLAKKGAIAARPTLLGFCMTQSCKYGGVESAVHCAGVDGKGPCKDAIFSKRNSTRLQNLYDSNTEDLKRLVGNTPRRSKLKAENEAIEVYFHATSTDR